MKPKNHNIQRDLTLLTISTFALVFAWIGFSVYHTSVTSTISQDLLPKIQPISNNFDLETLRNLKERSVIVPEFTSVAASDSGALLENEVANTNEEANPVIEDEISVDSPTDEENQPNPEINTEEPTNQENLLQ